MEKTDLGYRHGKEEINKVAERTLTRVTITPGDPGFPVPESVTISNPGGGLCATCKGFGWLRSGAVDIHDPMFGKLIPCPGCTVPAQAEASRSAVYAMSALSDLSDKTFDNFMTSQLASRTDYTAKHIASLSRALETCRQYARMGRGWLVMAGPYGCGKTHLAAAIANETKIPALFITLPDLLDQLRDGFDDRENSYQDRFDRVREIPLLVLDDLGAQVSTPWAGEKVFQLVNARYVREIPTVFTTNVETREIDGRILSRMSDQHLSTKLVIDAPDFRRNK